MTAGAKKKTKNNKKTTTTKAALHTMNERAHIFICCLLFLLVELRFTESVKIAVTVNRVVFEAEASGGSKAGGLPHPSLSPFPPLPLSIPPKFSDKPVGGKVRSSEGKVPRLPPYKYHTDGK